MEQRLYQQCVHSISTKMVVCSLCALNISFMCLYRKSALPIHLCVSPPKETDSLSLYLSPAPLLPHNPAHTSSSGWTNHRLSLCHPHTHMHAHTYTHTFPPSPSFPSHALFLQSSSSFISHKEDVSTYHFCDICGFLTLYVEMWCLQGWICVRRSLQNGFAPLCLYLSELRGL